MKYGQQSVRTIRQTGQFKRDLARKAKGKYRTILEDTLVPVVTALAADNPLEIRHRDHALTGAWKNYRDCHIKPDLVLIYQKPDDETLYLVRLGSHADLGI
jgi:mRNA interferase YafQ